MIIFLTGKPGIGKSTAIKNFIALNEGPMSWVVTNEILRSDGSRAGFAATNSDGETRVISHKTDIKSDVVIGVNHVDLAAVDALFASAFHEATKENGRLAVVDEIGPIQLLSSEFLHTLKQVFSDGADLIATIHYKDEQLEEYRNSPLALRVEVTLDNRDMLPKALLAFAKNCHVINGLSPTQQAKFFGLARRYFADAKLLQIQKLTNNAIHYLTAGNIESKGARSWIVGGKHGDHHVVLKTGVYVCDCDLFNGRQQYAESPGECSHIQAIILASAS